MLMGIRIIMIFFSFLIISCEKEESEESPQFLYRYLHIFYNSFLRSKVQLILLYNNIIASIAIVICAIKLA